MISPELKSVNNAINKLKMELEKTNVKIAELTKNHNSLERKIFQQDEDIAGIDKIKNAFVKKAQKKELACLKAVEFTDENIAKVRQMAIAMTKEQIARSFNMSLTTYLKREEELPILKEAFECGKHEFMAEATSALVNHIKNGDTKMLQYFMDNVMKMRQQDQTQITISQEFIDKKLTIVNDNLTTDDDYENEIKKKFHNQIMSITISKDNQNENDEE